MWGGSFVQCEIFFILPSGWIPLLLCLLGRATSVSCYLTLTSLHHLTLLSHFLLVSLAQALSLGGGVCRYSWCVSCSAAWYCSVIATVAKRAAGHAGRHTHTPGQDKSLPRDSLFIRHITILPVSHREQGQMGAGVGGVLLFHPGVMSKHLRIAFTVMTSGTFPFPSNQKILQDWRFQP